MAIRILYLIFGFVLAVNLVLSLVGLITGVNLYQKYGKQILKFFAGFGLFVVAAYVIFAMLGLK